MAPHPQCLLALLPSMESPFLWNPPCPQDDQAQRRPGQVSSASPPGLAIKGGFHGRPAGDGPHASRLRPCPCPTAGSRTGISVTWRHAGQGRGCGVGDSPDKGCPTPSTGHLCQAGSWCRAVATLRQCQTQLPEGDSAAPWSRWPSVRCWVPAQGRWGAEGGGAPAHPNCCGEGATELALPRRWGRVEAAAMAQGGGGWRWVGAAPHCRPELAPSAGEPAPTLPGRP